MPPTFLHEALNFAQSGRPCRTTARAPPSTLPPRTSSWIWWVLDGAGGLELGWSTEAGQTDGSVRACVDCAELACSLPLPLSCRQVHHLLNNGAEINQRDDKVSGWKHLHAKSDGNDNSLRGWPAGRVAPHGASGTTPAATPPRQQSSVGWPRCRASRHCTALPSWPTMTATWRSTSICW